MGEYNWDDDDDEQQDETTLLRDLRKQIKDMGKALKERDAELTALRPRVRQTEVASVLTELGVKNPKLARFILKDVDDISRDSVKEWLNENGDLFGIEFSGSKQDDAPEGNASQDASKANLPPDLSPEVIDAIRRLQNADASASFTPDKDASELAALQALNAQAKSSTDFFNLLRTANG